MSKAKPERPSDEGRRFSYVMGGPDPFDTSDKGWLGVTEVTEGVPPPKATPSGVTSTLADDEEEEETKKKAAWKKNEDIPLRFDELPSEEKWVNVSDVIRRQREEQARRDARQNKPKPPPDPKAESSDSESDQASKGRGPARTKEEIPERGRGKEESEESQDEDDSQGVDPITQSMLQFALTPGLMRERGLERRGSLPITPTPAGGRLDRRSSLWTADDRPARRRSSFEEDDDERPPFRHSPREHHVRRGRSPRRSFTEERRSERPQYREPSPDYDESPPRAPSRRDFEPGRRGHAPHGRHHDPDYDDDDRRHHHPDDDDRRPHYPDDDDRRHHYPDDGDRRHHYPDDDDRRPHYPDEDRRPHYPDAEWEYDQRPRAHSRDDPRDDYPRSRHPMDSRYEDDDYRRQSGYDRDYYDNSPERYGEGGERRNYFRQSSDPRHGRGSQAYSHPQYR